MPQNNLTRRLTGNRLIFKQCPKLSFYFVHSQGALPIKLHPEIAPGTLPIYSNNKWLKKRAHTGCTSPKIVHPAGEMCAPGAPLISDNFKCRVFPRAKSKLVVFRTVILNAPAHIKLDTFFNYRNCEITNYFLKYMFT